MQMIIPAEQIDFELNKQLLNRYRFIEHETVRILAAWLPATARMELKLAMGRWLWADAQHVQQLYHRLREVQTPAFRPPGDKALEQLIAEALHAPDEWNVLAGIFRLIKPALAEAYHWHINQTFATPDSPTLYAFKHVLLDETEQLQEAIGLLASHPAGPWEAYLAGLLAAAGGVTGQVPRGQTPQVAANRTPFQPPRQAARDSRFNLVNRNA